MKGALHIGTVSGIPDFHPLDLSHPHRLDRFQQPESGAQCLEAGWSVLFILSLFVCDPANWGAL
ncbi:MAG: hypothetical protein IPJ82_25695 [Lewinellaceae bacterium]|nr:hypothetical protein [Lewinellaceae bacterium]